MGTNVPIFGTINIWHHKYMVKPRMFVFWDFGNKLRYTNDIPDAHEVLKNLPGAHGFVVD